MASSSFCWVCHSLLTLCCLHFGEKASGRKWSTKTSSETSCHRPSGPRYVDLHNKRNDSAGVQSFKSCEIRTTLFNHSDGTGGACDHSSSTDEHSRGHQTGCGLSSSFHGG